MIEYSDEQILRQSAAWVEHTVVGCGFCPFAYKVVAEQSIRYELIRGTALHEHPEKVLAEARLLQEQAAISTSLIIFPDAYEHFSAYLQLVKRCEQLLLRKGFEGIFQIASFHPEYLFGGASEDDAANYTNRSPYPMIHLIREEELAEALANFRAPERIPERNIRFAREKGAEYLKDLLRKAMHT